MAKPILSRYIQPEVLTRLAQQHVLPRQLVEGTLAGSHKSPFHGFAVEFASHRQYVPGDDLRHLDWKVYYRHDRLSIKQYEMETNFVAHLLLDVSASMRYGAGDAQKLLYASRLAVTLAYLIIEQHDKVSLATIDESVRGVVPPSNTMAQVIRMTEALDQVKSVAKTSLGPAIGELAGRMGRRGIVIILSDAFADLDDLDSALQRLRYEKQEVVLLQVLHHDEIHFDMGGMIRFRGLEDEDHIITRPDDIRAGYLAAYGRFDQRLSEVCDANHCERLVCDTSRPISELLADYLHQRTRIHRRW